jgi:hypothetical protein
LMKEIVLETAAHKDWLNEKITKHGLGWKEVKKQGGLLASPLKETRDRVFEWG